MILFINFSEESYDHPHLDYLGTEYFAKSMLVTNVGDEMCWRPLWDVGDGENSVMEIEKAASVFFYFLPANVKPL